MEVMWSFGGGWLGPGPSVGLQCLPGGSGMESGEEGVELSCYPRGHWNAAPERFKNNASRQVDQANEKRTGEDPMKPARKAVFT